MDINQRHKLILDAIVSMYIANGEPIASQALQDALDITVSSATLRNEMARLTKLGYLEDMGTSSDEDVFLMEDTILSDYIEDEGQRLIFMFDYMTERSFFIEMKEMITGKKLKDPLCTLAIGKAPVQIMDIKEFETKIDAKIAAASVEDLDEEFYGADEFNEDEFEAEGFEEMTFED